MLVFLLSLGLLTTFVSSAKLPPNVKLCSKKDPNFLRCVEKNMMLAIQAFGPGSPELGVPRLEPFFIEKLEIHGSQTGSVKLDQNYHNVNIYGFSISKLSNLSIDHEKCHWEFDSAAPNIRMESDYQLNGQLLVFPINGHGKSNVTMGNAGIHYNLDCVRVQKKGKTHLQVKKMKLDMVTETIHLDFENIFPGNEQISNEVLKTVNENGAEIFKDVKSAFEQAFEQIFTFACNKVFNKLSEAEVFLD